MDVPAPAPAFWKRETELALAGRVGWRLFLGMWDLYLTALGTQGLEAQK